MDLKLDIFEYDQYRHVAGGKDLSLSENVVTILHGKLPDGKIVSVTIDTRTFEEIILPLFEIARSSEV